MSVPCIRGTSSQKIIRSFQIWPLNILIFRHSNYKEADLKLITGSLRKKPDGTVSLDFANPEASRVLAKAVLKTEFDLEADLPKGHLIPTVNSLYKTTDY